MMGSRKSSYDRTVTLQRFRLLFRHADKKWLADRLGVSEKQVQRYFNDESDPTPKVLAAMKALIEEQKDDLAFVGLLEQIRAHAEIEQAKNPHLEIEGIEERDIPGWYADVRVDIFEHRYADALVILRQRRKHMDDWDRIPDKTKPYVLGSLGLAAYYTGRWVEAAEAFQSAVTLSRSIRNDSPSLFLAGYISNRGLALMRQVRYEEAFECFREAADIAPFFLANFYNAVCAASLMKDAEWVGNWAGRLETAARMAKPADIVQVLQTYKNDSDLVFARECDTFQVAIEGIEAILIRSQKGNDNGSR